MKLKKMYNNKRTYIVFSNLKFKLKHLKLFYILCSLLKLQFKTTLARNKVRSLRMIV